MIKQYFQRSYAIEDQMKCILDQKPWLQLY